MSRLRQNILTVAGFDPSGGAGVLADIKAFEANKTLGSAVQTALTIQNKSVFNTVYWTPFTQIKEQLDVLYLKEDFSYVKIGLVENLEILDKIITYILSKNNKTVIVWDPILKASAGYKIHNDFDKILLDEILSKITFITPNFNECKILFGNTELNEMQKIVNSLKGVNIILKGGHNENSKGKDYLLVKGENVRSFNPKNIHNIFEKHGSGCVFSSVLIANLANGYPIRKAILRTKRYMESFLSSSSDLLGYHLK